MNMRLQTPIDATSTQYSAPAMNGRLQCKQAFCASSVLDVRNDERYKTASGLQHNSGKDEVSSGVILFDQELPGSDQKNLGHNLNRLPIYPSNASFEPFLSAHTDGASLITSREELDEIFIDAPPKPTPAPEKKPPDTGKKATPAGCPVDIKVAAVGNMELNEGDAKAGWLTGWGGFAKMQVSDPSGKKWDGTLIHENLSSGKDTCEGDPKSCGNPQGDNGAAGSTFTVGEKGHLPGFGDLPAESNCFYDLHFVGIKGSLLHKLGRDKCEIECKQYYDCGGKKIGSDFTIIKAFKKDVIVSGSNRYNVTRVELNKK